MGKVRERKRKIKPKHQKDPAVIENKTQIREKLSSRQKQRFKKRLLKDELVTKVKKEKAESETPEHSTKKMLFETEELDDENNLIVKDFGNLAELESDDSCDFPDDRKTENNLHEKMDVSDSVSNKEEIPNDDVITNLNQDIGKTTLLGVDVKVLDERIRNGVLMLSDFKNRAPEGVKRFTVLAGLRKDLCSRYDYNEFLMSKLMDLFPKDILEFIEANEVDRPVTIRTNTLKTRRKELAQALINRGVNLDPLEPWSKVGLVIYSSQVPLGATPEYLAGHYILQGASSLLPVMALAPQMEERILDMCAAPGGKTTYVAQLMKNTGTLFANELNPSRAKSLLGNCHRMGITNTVICVSDARKFPSHMTGFDRVLLDAPCSGTGVIAKDHSVKAGKTGEDIDRCTTLQKELLRAAIDCTRDFGYVVYSTCSVLIEENEAVVDYVCRARRVKIEETRLFGEPGFTSIKGLHFNPNMNRTRRYYPHKHNVDGFFVAKLQKLPANQSTNQTSEKEDSK